MSRWKWFSSIGLFLSTCSGPPGVLVDIGSWPEGAASLSVAGSLDGAPSMETVSFPSGTTHFLIYVPEGRRGQLGLSLVALDEENCPRATAETQVGVGSGLRQIAEVQVTMAPAAPPYCPGPALQGITPGSGSTDGGILLTLSGQGIKPGATVTVDGYPVANPMVISPTQMTATLPMHLGAFGLVPVVLQNSDGQRASRSDLFAYYTSQFSFSNLTAYDTGKYPQQVATGDFNRDGVLDLVVANGISTVSVLLGDGKGSFGPAKDISTGANSTLVAVGDFNADNRADLAVVAYGSGSVNILLGDGKGGFGTRNDILGLDTPGGMTLGDFNGDGASDLAVVNYNGNSVNVLLGNKQGGFGAFTPFATGTGPQTVAVGDFNGDHRADLAVGNSGSTDVSVLLGDGQGGFAAARNFPVKGGPGSVAVGDFNGDKKPDMAVTNPPSNVSILLGDGQGGFGAAKDYNAGASPYQVVLADFNGDQLLDLVTVSNGESKLHVLLGDGKGGFSAAAVLPCGNNTRAVAVGDFNGDKKPDLAASNYFGDNISVFLNQSQ